MSKIGPLLALLAPFGWGESSDRNKNYSISVPDAGERVVSNPRVASVEARKVMLVALPDGGSLVVDLGVLVPEVEVPLLLPDVAHDRVLPILVHQEALLGGSEDVGIVVHH